MFVPATRAPPIGPAARGPVLGRPGGPRRHGPPDALPGDGRRQGDHRRRRPLLRQGRRGQGGAQGRGGGNQPFCASTDLCGVCCVLFALRGSVGVVRFQIDNFFANASREYKFFTFNRII